jgi:hypothetical protein
MFSPLHAKTLNHIYYVFSVVVVLMLQILHKINFIIRLKILQKDQKYAKLVNKILLTVLSVNFSLQLQIYSGIGYAKLLRK